jgi:predicted transcriptional regulator
MRKKFPSGLFTRVLPITRNGCEGNKLKSTEEQMEILEAYELMGTVTGAANLLGVSHHTVQRYLDARDAGHPVVVRKQQSKLIDPYLGEVVQMVEMTKGKIRADKVHQKIVKLGYTGCQRTTNYAVRQEKLRWQAANQRVHRPWVPEPGLWLQYDFGDGPVIGGMKTVLFIAWLGFSRLRIVIPLWDRQLPTVVMALDQTFRMLAGIPVYVLSDNEKSLTTQHIANLPVRNQAMVEVGRFYSTTFHTCQVYDPASKGGVERAVGVMKDDLLPKDTNLRGEYASFSELQLACDEFMCDINTRVHSVTGRVPQQAFEQDEKPLLHRVPDHPYSLTLGEERKVPKNTPMVTFHYGQYSVPYTLMGTTVRVRFNSDHSHVIISAITGKGVIEMARHEVTKRGVPAICDAHFPPKCETPLNRSIRPQTVEEKAFCDLGEGAQLWLREATSRGVRSIRWKMDQAVTLAKFEGAAIVDDALGFNGIHGRFSHDDLVSVVGTSPNITTTKTIDDDHTLAQGTAVWAALGEQP